MSSHKKPDWMYSTIFKLLLLLAVLGSLLFVISMCYVVVGNISYMVQRMPTHQVIIVEHRGLVGTKPTTNNANTQPKAMSIPDRVVEQAPEPLDIDMCQAPATDTVSIDKTPESKVVTLDGIDKAFAVRYVEKETDRFRKIVLFEWKGKKEIAPTTLSRTVYGVLDRLSFVPTSPDVHHLVMETIATESNMGYYTKQTYGRAVSICQIEPSTARYIEQWLKTNHNDIYKEIKELWEYSESDKWNHTYNVPYNIALCLAIYWSRAGHDIVELSADRTSRARFYKRAYNTFKGKNNVRRYISDASTYLDKS